MDTRGNACPAVIPARLHLPRWVAIPAALLLSFLPASAAGAEKPATAGNGRAKIAHVFFAQQHVQAPGNPYFKLVGNLDTLVKIHLSGTPGSPVPEVRVRVAVGAEGLDLPVKGPGLLPAPVGNPIMMEHTYEDSFTTFIPRKWVRPGLQMAIELRARKASGGGTVIDRKVYDRLPVGAPTRLIMWMFDFHYFGGAQGADYPEGWFEELGSKLPVAELELRRVRNIILDKLVMPPQYDGPAVLCSSREEYQKKTGHRFDGEQGVAGRWNGALKAAAGAGWGGTRRLYYSNIYGVHSGGTAGGLSGRGNGRHVGILHHELGHAFGLPHWAGKENYPYVGSMHGIEVEAGKPHVGPVWAFDPVRREFISPIHNGTFKHDPMQGGGANRAGGPHLMTPFSDYSVSRIRDLLERTQVVWDAQGGSYKAWNQDQGDYSTTVRSRGGPNCPVEDDIDVISVLASASLVTPEANIVYPPIGPYKAGRLEPYQGRSSLCLRITQGGNTKTCPVKTDLQPGGDPKDPKTFAVFAVNLPARDGEVTQADLIHTAGGKVAYSWKAASSPAEKTQFVTALYPAGASTDIAQASRPQRSNGSAWKSPAFLRKPAAEVSAGDAKTPAATAPGDASATPKPPAPAARPVADAKAVAAWDAKLLGRTRAILDAKTRLVFRPGALGVPVTVLAVTKQSMSVRMEGGGNLELAWSQLKPPDKRNLAMAMVAAKDTQGDYALAAFYLLLEGDLKKADYHLARAGMEALFVRAAFGLEMK